MTCYEDLVFRGLIKDMTSNEDFIEKLNNGGMTFYIGTDPTADSLHLGHLSSFLICERLARYGHHPIVLVGGATGLIGDPRPTKERETSNIDIINKNVEGIKNQLAKYFPNCEMVNNYEWTKDVTYIEFLREYGKYFNINYMINKDIIKRRLDEGISYTEFSYMLMQAYDFLWLYEHKNCVMQVAGQDQWGNITSGVELIRKKLDKEAYAFTMPLVTTKSGVKFGKSEGNALWLDKDKTSPYDMYQYLIIRKTRWLSIILNVLLSYRMMKYVNWKLSISLLRKSVKHIKHSLLKLSNSYMEKKRRLKPEKLVKKYSVERLFKICRQLSLLIFLVILWI